MHALDSCRIEKAYRHWGHDISDEDTPIEAGLMFAVKLEQGARFHRPRRAAAPARGAGDEAPAAIRAARSRAAALRQRADLARRVVWSAARRRAPTAIRSAPRSRSAGSNTPKSRRADLSRPAGSRSRSRDGGSRRARASRRCTIPRASGSGGGAAPYPAARCAPQRRRGRARAPPRCPPAPARGRTSRSVLLADADEQVGTPHKGMMNMNSRKNYVKSVIAALSGASMSSSWARLRR